MTYIPKPGNFALFKNDKKGNDRAPDYRGDGVDLQNQPIEVAAWLKEGKNGKFMACTMKPKGERQQAKQREPEPAGGVDDSTPF